jgi:hypothetical protein
MVGYRLQFASSRAGDEACPAQKSTERTSAEALFPTQKPDLHNVARY